MNDNDELHLQQSICRAICVAVIEMLIEEHPDLYLKYVEVLQIAEDDDKTIDMSVGLILAPIKNAKAEAAGE
jgi:hypothetical protein